MSYEQLFEFLKEFDGLIGALLGALLGSITTLIVTHILKNKGKIKVNINNPTFKTYGYDENGWQAYEMDFIEASGLELEFEIEVYNESESPKFINKLEVSLLDDNNNNNNMIETFELNLSESRRVTSGFIKYDSISYINVEPKKIIKKAIFCIIDFKNQEIAKEFKKIVLNYTDSDGKVYSKVLLTRESQSTTQ